MSYGNARRRHLNRKHCLTLGIAAAAVLAALSTALVLLLSHPKTEYFILTQDEINTNTARNEYASDEQRVFVESALSLVDKVSYFWGGKCYKTGPDAEWGKLRMVTSEGHSTSGTLQPYGLDCSGFVSWCYIQLGYDKQQMIDGIGNGTWNQWDKSTKVNKADMQLGDLAFINAYPGADGNHVGICVGFLETGEPLIAHCSNTQNNVVVSTCGDQFRYFRRPAFLNDVK